MKTDKRSSTRFPIQAVDFATVMINDSYILLGSVTNVCREGMHLELFPASPQNALHPGDCVSMSSCPKGLDRLLGGAKGTISWVEDNSCGILLDSPMKASHDELKSYFDKTNLSPWETQTP